MRRIRRTIVALVILAIACLWTISTKMFNLSEVLDSILKSEWQRYVERAKHERTLEWRAYARKAVNKTMSRRLPNIIGIGAKKCGTDAVISFLLHHPFVKVPENVETFFFNHKYKRGLDYYKRLMPPAANHEIVMEKTPAYFHTPPMELANRIYRDIPGVQVILVLCEPVKRSFSDYTHERARYSISKSADVVAKYPTFDSYLDVYIPIVNKTLSIGRKAMLKQHMNRYYSDHAATILTTGFYSLHLSRWMDLFSNDSLLIVNGEEVLTNPGFQVEKMQEFLNIPKLLLKEDFVLHPNTGLYCIRPWWTDYDFVGEKENQPGWHENLACLGKSKGRTRHSNGSFAVTDKNLASLRQLYTTFNQELFEITGIDYRNSEHSTERIDGVRVVDGEISLFTNLSYPPRKISLLSLCSVIVISSVFFTGL